jgi:hypothetical protein
MRWFERTVLKRVFVPAREELAGDCIELHNVELRNFYSLQAAVGLQNVAEMGRSCSNR